MKHLYIAYDNSMNYILIRDFSREEDDTIVCDWDLNDDEIEDIKARFERGEYDETNGAAADEAEWISWEEAQEQFNTINSIEW